jgi:hypothetical protein
MTQPTRTKAYIARKKQIPMVAEIAQAETLINTLEGPRTAYPGDYIMTGLRGENWAVPGDKFDDGYDILGRTPDGRLQVQSKPLERAIFQTYRPLEFTVRDEKFHADAGDIIVLYGADDMAPVKLDIFYETYEIVRPATPEEEFAVAAV